MVRNLQDRRDKELEPVLGWAQPDGRPDAHLLPSELSWQVGQSPENLGNILTDQDSPTHICNFEIYGSNGNAFKDLSDKSVTQAPLGMSNSKTIDSYCSDGYK